MTRRKILIGMILTLCWAGPAHAHHLSATGPVGKTVHIEGEILRVEWMNPHTYFYVRAQDESGEDVDWEIEAWPVVVFIRGGLKRGMFEPGKRVKVSSTVPAADTARRYLRLESITRFTD